MKKKKDNSLKDIGTKQTQLLRDASKDIPEAEPVSRRDLLKRITAVWGEQTARDEDKGHLYPDFDNMTDEELTEMLDGLQLEQFNDPVYRARMKEKHGVIITVK